MSVSQGVYIPKLTSGSRVVVPRSSILSRSAFCIEESSLRTSLMHLIPAGDHSQRPGSPGQHNGPPKEAGIIRAGVLEQVSIEICTIKSLRA